MIELCCNFCNKIFYKYKSQIKHTLIFCNKKCEGNYRNKQVKQTCKSCNIEFYHRHDRPQNCCSKKCSSKLKENKIKCLCFLCNKEVFKVPSVIKKSKIIFCSCSCKQKHYIKEKPAIRKSKSETYLCSLIKREFPNVIISENTRTVLDSGFEIDIWIPCIELAIEINGPCHYYNIYNNKCQFDKTLERDKIKMEEILKKEYKFIIINVNDNEKIIKNRLDDQYHNIIKPLLIIHSQ